MSKKLKISHKDKPRMVESSLKIKQDPYAAEEINPSQPDEHSEAGKERDDNRVHPEEESLLLTDADQDQSAMFAEGGEVEDEANLEQAADAVASIMAKRRMARGGEILSEDDIDSDPSADQVDLAGNAEESQNQADQLSYNALRKENYDESSAIEDLTYNTERSVGRKIDSDEHDMVSSARRKIKR